MNHFGCWLLHNRQRTCRCTGSLASINLKQFPNRPLKSVLEISWALLWTFKIPLHLCDKYFQIILNPGFRVTIREVVISAALWRFNTYREWFEFYWVSCLFTEINGATTFSRGRVRQWMTCFFWGVTRVSRSWVVRKIERALKWTSLRYLPHLPITLCNLDVTEISWFFQSSSLR
jgi:hypothetical protein